MGDMRGSCVGAWLCTERKYKERTASRFLDGSGITARRADLDQLGLRRRRRHRHGLQRLRIAPVVQNPHLLHARHRTTRCAEFVRKIFAPAHLRRVLRQRNRRVTPLLRAPVHQSILANVQIPRSRTPPPPLLSPAPLVFLHLLEPPKSTP